MSEILLSGPGSKFEIEHAALAFVECAQIADHSGIQDPPHHCGTFKPISNVGGVKSSSTASAKEAGSARASATLTRTVWVWSSSSMVSRTRQGVPRSVIKTGSCWAARLVALTSWLKLSGTKNSHSYPSVHRVCKPLRLRNYIPSRGETEDGFSGPGQELTASGVVFFLLTRLLERTSHARCSICPEPGCYWW